MRPLISALLAFSLLIVAHLAVWRIRRPAGQYVGLFSVCLVVLVASVGSFYALQSVTIGLAPLVPATAFDYLNFMMLYTALALAYIVTYSAVQADSPTMTILLRIEQAEPSGLTLEEMLDGLGNQVLVMPRLNDLATGKLVSLHRGRYVIGSRGALLAKTHSLYRVLLKMEKGG